VDTGAAAARERRLPNNTLVVETAARYLAWSGLKTGQTVLINGAGTMVGFAAVQMALLQGARVIATAGATFTWYASSWKNGGLRRLECESADRHPAHKADRLGLDRQPPAASERNELTNPAVLMQPHG
jgi:hypothetical protein